jgi:hypothetical protein
MAKFDVIPGGILDGLNLLPGEPDVPSFPSPCSADTPWTASPDAMRDVPMPDYEDFIRPRPPGVSVDENILRAEKPLDIPWWKPSKAAKYELMQNLFQSGHEVDYKKGDPRYRDFGNFNFGAFGSALGLSPHELHGGAGYQQFKDKRWEIGYGIPGPVPPYGDNETDYKQIDAGIRYYRAQHPKE